MATRASSEPVAQPTPATGPGCMAARSEAYVGRQQQPGDLVDTPISSAATDVAHLCPCDPPAGIRPPPLLRMSRMSPLTPAAWRVVGGRETR